VTTPALRRGAALVALAALAGCDRGAGETMVRIEPPDAWREQLLESRESRDEIFRRSPDTPLRPAEVASFAGLDYWQPDPTYYFVGPLHRHPQPERFEIVTTSGEKRPCERYGWLSFPLAGASHTLQVYRLLDTGAAPDDVAALLLPFQDGTTGELTYPAGRYVDLAGLPGGPYVLDFNRAYNPSCAYGSPERFACPVTPPENRISLRIEAGERGYHRR
jgi:uncharacterized protein (DUF1684 family)